MRDEEYEYRFDEGGAVTLLTSAEALRDPFGTIIGAVSVSVDITERKRNDERQKLLINELNHRVKNTPTTVQSIARRTLRTAGSLAEAESALAERLVGGGPRLRRPHPRALEGIERRPRCSRAPSAATAMPDG